MFKMKLLLTLALISVLGAGAFAADQTLIPSGMNDWGVWYVLHNGAAQYDLMRTNMLYHNNGPMTKVNATTGVIYDGITAGAGTNDLVAVTQEIIVNGAVKFAAATAEVKAFQLASGSTVAAGYSRYYVIGCDGSTVTTTNSSYTCVVGTSVLSTEVAVVPAMTAGYVPIAMLKVSCGGSATFTPNTDNFDGAQITTVLTNLEIMNSGASLPAASSLDYPPAYAINQ